MIARVNDIFPREGGRSRLDIHGDHMQEGETNDFDSFLSNFKGVQKPVKFSMKKKPAKEAREESSEKVSASDEVPSPKGKGKRS